MESVKQAISAVAGATKPPEEPQGWLMADEVEAVKPDEDEKALKIGELIKKMQDHNFDQHQHKFRGTHVKSLAFVKGNLTISSDLPKHLQYGVFAHPGKTYPIIGRYANEPSFIFPDNQHMPRGFAMKIFGVEGPRLEEDGLNTQDFLFNNSPMVELTDIDTTLEIFQLREQYFDQPIRLQAELAKRSDRVKQFAPSMLPNQCVIGMEFFTQSSFSYGPYAAHFSLRPCGSEQSGYIGKSIPSDASPTFHRESLHDYYISKPAQYTLRAQFASDLSKHAVEDASTEWDEATAPWHDLGVIDIPAQETFSHERRTWWEDKIALSPFDGLRDHRPLGSINRLRKKVYAIGREHRAKGNAVKVEFPQGPEEMPE